MMVKIGESVAGI